MCISSVYCIDLRHAIPHNWGVDICALFPAPELCPCAELAAGERTKCERMVPRDPEG